MRPESNLYAFQSLVAKLESADQSPALDVLARPAGEPSMPDDAVDVADLRERWSKLTDIHQFFGTLRTLRLDRRQALRLVGATMPGGSTTTPSAR